MYRVMLRAYDPVGLDFNNQYQRPKDLKKNNNITKSGTAF